jgi:hypothetical protein
MVHWSTYSDIWVVRKPSALLTVLPGMKSLFHGYSDAAFANQEGSKSTSSYVFLASRGAITWKSKRQTIITLSTSHLYSQAVCLLNDNVLDIQNVHDPEQTADILMKALPNPKQQKHTREMGVLPMDITQ